MARTNRVVSRGSKPSLRRRASDRESAPLFRGVMIGTASSHTQEKLKMTDWFPLVFIVFKVLVLGTGMFFAVKWHYDKAKKK